MGNNGILIPQSAGFARLYGLLRLSVGLESASDLIADGAGTWVSGAVVTSFHQL
jgi:O-acetylhomoserine/O-acetylserine sulfhydrylase-like pyridoxal-dependent enzyme